MTGCSHLFFSYNRYPEFKDFDLILNQFSLQEADGSRTSFPPSLRSFLLRRRSRSSSSPPKLESNSDLQQSKNYPPPAASYHSLLSLTTVDAGTTTTWRETYPWKAGTSGFGHEEIVGTEHSTFYRPPPRRNQWIIEPESGFGQFFSSFQK